MNRKARFLICKLPVAMAAVWLSVAWCSPDDPIPTWRTPGKDGQSCTSCHTPSGVEIVRGPFGIGDIRRRSNQHLSDSDVKALVLQIESERTRHPVGSAPNRPFAAEGSPLWGDTPEERDQAFGESLNSQIPTLRTGQVWTLVDAERAESELCGKPLNTVRTGFVIDQVSRDPFKKMDGPSLADWIPDVGLSRKGTEAFEESCRRNRDVNGHYDVTAINSDIEKVEGPPKTSIDRLSRLKRLALLRFAETVETGKPLPRIQISPAMPDEPIWAVGKLAKSLDGLTPVQLGMTEAESKKAELKLQDPLDLKPMALSWMWIAWTIDPSLQSTSLDRQTGTGQYLAKMFWDAGPFPWHAAYFAARRPLEQRRLANSTQALLPEINAFVNEEVLESLAPKDNSEFVLFCANLLRMDCLLLERDLKAGRVIQKTPPVRQQLGALWSFVRPRISTSDSEKTRTIFDRTMTLLK